MVIDSKTASREAYPWFFFYRIARLTLLVFLPLLLFILIIYRSSYQESLLSTTKIRLKKELQTLDHALKVSGTSWKSWCQNVPTYKSYELKFPEETLLCGKKIETEDYISATIESGEINITKKIPLSTLKEEYENVDEIFFFSIFPVSLLTYLLFIYLFYRSTLPLGMLLSKVEKFRDNQTFNRKLNHLYLKDEWKKLEETLTKADQRLMKQGEEAKIENEKNKTILESINDAIIAIDRFESILFYNTKFQKIFMPENDGHAINKKAWHIFEKEVLQAFKDVLNTGSPKILRGISIPLKNNPGRYFDLTITPLNSGSSKINGVLGVFYDVTHFKLTEQMRVDFVANVSHEIRTPLTSIKGFSQILQAQSDKVDKSLMPFLDKIITNTERMISLFNDLLNLSVIESKDELISEEIPLDGIVDEVESNLMASYPDKKITFKKDLGIKIIHGDFRLIEQVILNLCDNACKYTREEVSISIESFIKKNKAIIKISDDGPGIGQEHLHRIFERFYRVDASRESLRGTGLGLSIVKQIVTKHGGTISAHSEGAGKGTTFTIELPLK